MLKYLNQKNKNGIINKMKNIYFYWKRLLDIILSIIALILFSPLFLIIFLINKIDNNKGPLLYKQVRIGYHHKPFRIYKFRTMVEDADKILKNNPKLYAQYVKNNYKLENDPRITKFGKWLRKTSLDEIPQFLNILYGDMSIIGPRPIVRKELEKEYSKSEADKLLSVKPGAMGLWQATGRSNISYPKRAKLELSYVEQVSFLFDVKIFFKNILSIFKHEGAY